MRAARVAALPDAVSHALEQLLGERVGHVTVSYTHLTLPTN